MTFDKSVEGWAKEGGVKDDDGSALQPLAGFGECDCFSSYNKSNTMIKVSQIRRGAGGKGGEENLQRGFSFSPPVRRKSLM